MTQQEIITYAILAIYNLSAIKLISIAVRSTDIKEAVKEKNLTPRPIVGYTHDSTQHADETSYSRVIGLIGSGVMASFFWAVGNVVLFKSFTAPAEISSFVTGLSGYFLSGAALFLPYAVNQLRSAFTSQ